MNRLIKSAVMIALLSLIFISTSPVMAQGGGGEVTPFPICEHCGSELSDANLFKDLTVECAKSGTIIRIFIYWCPYCGKPSVIKFKIFETSPYPP